VPELPDIADIVSTRAHAHVSITQFHIRRWKIAVPIALDIRNSAMRIKRYGNRARAILPRSTTHHPFA